jgi:Polyketide cyclase / dehydrase and lipid transport
VHDSVTVHMTATPEHVWDLVSDVTRIGRYSPETFEAVWIDGATGPAVGARFRGHVKRNGKGPIYWTTCTVSACERGRTFAFGVGDPDKDPLSVWGYDITPAGDGCDVTESFSLAPTWWLRLYWSLLGWARGKTNREDMRTTLERIRDDAEADAKTEAGGI